MNELRKSSFSFFFLIGIALLFFIAGCPSDGMRPCTSDRECFNGQQCTDGTCREVGKKPCTSDKNCLNGQRCTSGTCKEITVGTCTKDTECSSGERCVSGTCQKQSHPDGGAPETIIPREDTPNEGLPDRGTPEERPNEQPNNSITKLVDWSQNRRKTKQARSFPFQGYLMHATDAGWFIARGSECRLFKSGRGCELNWHNAQGTLAQKNKVLGLGMWTSDKLIVGLKTPKEQFCTGEEPWSEDHFTGDLSILDLRKGAPRKIWSHSNVLFNQTSFYISYQKPFFVYNTIKPISSTKPTMCPKIPFPQKGNFIHIPTGKEMISTLEASTPTGFGPPRIATGNEFGVLAIYSSLKAPPRSRIIWQKIDGSQKTLFNKDIAFYPGVQSQAAGSPWLHITRTIRPTSEKGGEINILLYNPKTEQSKFTTLSLPAGGYLIERGYGRWYQVCRVVKDLKGNSQNCTLHDLFGEFEKRTFSKTKEFNHIIDEFTEQLFTYHLVNKTIERTDLRSGKKEKLFSNISTLRSERPEFVIGGAKNIFFLAKDTLLQLSPQPRKISIQGLLSTKTTSSALLIFAKGRSTNEKHLFAWKFGGDKLFKLSSQAYAPGSANHIFCKDPSETSIPNAIYFSEIAPNSKDELNVFLVPNDLSGPPVFVSKQKGDKCVKPSLSTDKQSVIWPVYTQLDTNKALDHFQGKVHFAKIP